MTVLRLSGRLNRLINMLKSRFNLADSKTKEDTEDDLEEDPEDHKAAYQAEEDEQHTYEQLGEGVTEEEEKKPVFAERRLHRAEVSVRLSLLGLTAEGDGYTYLKAVCTGMSLTNISAIQYFKHLQFLDVSNNNLESEALQVVAELPFLVLIHADKNVLTTANLKKMKYLQVIIMNNNNITSVHEVYQPELRTLEVGYNKIRRLFFVSKMQSITCLDFRYNFIRDITELDFPNLDSLYLAGNKIVSLVGLERLVNLRILHVRYNPIKLLDGFEDSHKKLQYINLRNCKVATLRQIKKLRVLPALETLVMKGCPFMGGTGEENAEGGQEEDDAEIRIEMLAALPRLKRINKGVIAPEERIEAKELMAQWLAEGEKDEEEIEDEHNEGESNVDE